jgi:hypothetical protein
MEGVAAMIEQGLVQDRLWLTGPSGPLEGQEISAELISGLRSYMQDRLAASG